MPNIFKSFIPGPIVPAYGSQNTPSPSYNPRNSQGYYIDGFQYPLFTVYEQSYAYEEGYYVELHYTAGVRALENQGGLFLMREDAARHARNIWEALFSEMVFQPEGQDYFSNVQLILDVENTVPEVMVFKAPTSDNGTFDITCWREKRFFTQFNDTETVATPILVIQLADGTLFSRPLLIDSMEHIEFEVNAVNDMRMYELIDSAKLIEAVISEDDYKDYVAMQTALNATN